jgi:hypothetical protein
MRDCFSKCKLRCLSQVRRQELCSEVPSYLAIPHHRRTSIQRSAFLLRYVEKFEGTAIGQLSCRGEVRSMEELGQTSLMSREGIPRVLSFCSSRSDMFYDLRELIWHYRRYHESLDCYEDILQRYKLFVRRP